MKGSLSGLMMMELAAPQPPSIATFDKWARETNALGGACFIPLLLIHFSFCLQPIF